MLICLTTTSRYRESQPHLQTRSCAFYNMHTVRRPHLITIRWADYYGGIWKTSLPLWDAHRGEALYSTNEWLFFASYLICRQSQLNRIVYSVYHRWCCCLFKRGRYSVNIRENIFLFFSYPVQANHGRYAGDKQSWTRVYLAQKYIMKRTDIRINLYSFRKTNYAWKYIIKYLFA